MFEKCKDLVSSFPVNEVRVWVGDAMRPQQPWSDGSMQSRLYQARSRIAIQLKLVNV